MPEWLQFCHNFLSMPPDFFCVNGSKFKIMEPLTKTCLKPKKSLGLKDLWPFLTPNGWFFGRDLFQNMFHKVSIYTNNFCFGYINVSCFFESFTRLAGWLPYLLFVFDMSIFWASFELFLGSSVFFLFFFAL